MVWSLHPEICRRKPLTQQLYPRTVIRLVYDLIIVDDLGQFWIEEQLVVSKLKGRLQHFAIRLKPSHTMCLALFKFGSDKCTLISPTIYCSLRWSLIDHPNTDRWRRSVTLFVEPRLIIHRWRPTLSRSMVRFSFHSSLLLHYSNHRWKWKKSLFGPRPKRLPRNSIAFLCNRTRRKNFAVFLFGRVQIDAQWNIYSL